MEINIPLMNSPIFITNHQTGREYLEAWKYTTIYHVSISRPINDYTLHYSLDEVCVWAKENIEHGLFGGMHKGRAIKQGNVAKFMIGDNCSTTPNAVAFKLRWL